MGLTLDEKGRRRRERRKEGLWGLSFAGTIPKTAVSVVGDGALTLD